MLKASGSADLYFEAQF